MQLSYSSGGTAAALRSMNLDVTDVSDVTKFPEMLGLCLLSVCVLIE